MMLQESFKYTPLKKIESLYYPESTPHAPYVLPHPLPTGVHVEEIEWQAFKQKFAELPPNHPALQNTQGKAWRLTISAAYDAHEPLILNYSGSMATQQFVGIDLELLPDSRCDVQQTFSDSGALNVLLHSTIGEGAQLSLLRLQNMDKTHGSMLGLTRMTLAQNSAAQTFTVNSGARLARIEDHIHLTSPHSNIKTTTLMLLKERQHGDITSVIHHDAEQTTSIQECRTVLADDTTGVFQGLIKVSPHAQKTDGQQMSRALLLSPSATMNTKPELEIFADDVKCSHGAAIGALDDQMLFYLRARGIPDQLARQLLIEAFICEPLQELSQIASFKTEKLLRAYIESDRA